MSVRVRYAPSPTGSPHVGNLRTAIFCWLFARRHGGTFVARLEDTDRDPARYRSESIGEIEESLRFLGIVPDEWWVSGGDYGPYVQSERLGLYREVADDLLAKGMAYRCFCTEERLADMRATQQARGLPTGYDRHCRSLPPEAVAASLAAATPHTVRLAVPLEGRTTYTDLVYGDVSVENRCVDDQVLLKSNGWPTYHLGVVVDDYLMRITHVMRGEDWMPSTPKQVLIYQAMGWGMPQWAHLPLIVGPDRRKLGKRHGATQFVDFIRQGYLPEALLNFLVLLGWSAGEENRELFTVTELLERFDLDGVTNHPAVFDYDKLRWMNGEYIRKTPPDALVASCIPRLTAAGLVGAPPSPDETGYVSRMLPLVVDRIRVLSEIAEAVRFFFEAPRTPDDKGLRKWLSGPDAEKRLSACLEAFTAATGDLREADVEHVVNEIADGLGVARAPVIHTLRVATTGLTVGPGLFELISVLGRERVVSRLQHARTWILQA